jgi:hypothetical protein
MKSVATALGEGTVQKRSVSETAPRTNRSIGRLHANGGLIQYGSPRPERIGFEIAKMENLMLTLDLPRGVRVEIRPATTAVMAAAQVGSARRLGALRAAEADLDPDMARGLAFAFLVKALARHAVTAWEGVGDTAGKPLALSPEAVERLMDMDEIAAAFWDRATGPVAAVSLEGNV